MAKQSYLEEIGFERRQVEQARSDYNKNDEYSSQHEDAKTHDDENHPFGKGTGHGGHTHSIPNHKLGKNRYIPQLDTTDGGGSYDKYGRNENGGRKRLFAINMYNEENQYGAHLIDTTLNREDGQYFVD